jgi:hypothetical protein
MSISIEKVEGGYLARVTPPHGGGRMWASERPQSKAELITELQAMGCHQTDIGDALFQADRSWLSED